MTDIQHKNPPTFFQLDWQNYKNKLNEVNERNEQASYNIISVSTYSGHLENYHSDVWGFLLDKHAAHKKGNIFLSIFIDFLHANNLISAGAMPLLKNATVHREKGRIDVLIVNELEGICVIIENKINNAVDQHNQLERYKEIALKKNWEIAAMLYVTLTGGTLTTMLDDIIQVHPVSTVGNDNSTFLKGWLIPSKESIPFNNDLGNENARSFLHQYIMLLENLSTNKMNNMAIDFLYELVNSRENFETAQLIVSQLDNIKLHRVAVFSTSIEKHFDKKDYFKPAFKKRLNYINCPNYMIFEKFDYDKTSFQLDIIHYNNRTTFVFYTNSKDYKAEDSSLLLARIIGPHEFVSVVNDGHQISYTIQLNNDFASLNELDEKVKEYAISIFESFNKFSVTNSFK